MPIRKLPPLLVNQIAAGEVIERPASVVKELVENSLDAQARRIEITVEEGGRQLVRVSDDGRGILGDQLPLAVATHATSKLTSTEQLAAIASLGFRGEALASIASVSRLFLTSRPTRAGVVAEAASRIEASGDQVSKPAPAPAAPGTVVEVRDLFLNTPARRKFLRTAGTEFGHINETVTRIAMVHHDVAFKLTHNQRTVLDLPAGKQRLDRCLELLGKDLQEALLAFEQERHEAPLAHLWGVAAVPDMARSSAKFIYLFVNGRPVRDRNLNHAVKEAYRGLIPPDKYPMAVVMLDIDPAEVDVNVHPAKSEVRFRQPSFMHGLVLTAMRQRLLGSDLTPSASMEYASAGVFASAQGASAPYGAGGTGGTGGGAQLSADSFVDFFKRMDPKQKGFVFQQVKDVVDRDDSVLADQPSLPVPGAGALPGAGPAKAQSVLHVHNSYVVTQDDEGLLIIDQHALHERVMFETLRKRVLESKGNLESQRLLMPIILDADARRQATLERLGPLLKRIGIETQPIGPQQVAIHAFASILFDRNVEPIAFMNDLLDKADDGQLDISDPTAQEAALHKVLDMMSCKAAIKAGDHMSDDELTALLATRAEVERSSNCPHGRPTTLRLTLKDLEKQFGRR